jgi:tyrosinase
MSHTAPAPAARPTIVARPEVEQANIPALRDAYSKMQGLMARDNRSWIYWAEFHGFNRFDCWHHATNGPNQESQDPTVHSYDLFLPWHRAYLHAFDHAVRDQNPDAVQPWWDWTSATSAKVGVPTAYSEDPDTNPLASGPTPDMIDDPARRTRRFPGKPSELPNWTKTKSVQGDRLLAIDELLSLAKFEDFSHQLQNIHDFVHPWVGGISPDDPNLGGDMGSIPVAAFDPIFYAHHTMIDRLWYLWQIKHGVNNIPSNYLNQVLAPFGASVEQVLDINALGYEYASSIAAATAAGPARVTASQAPAAHAGSTSDSETGTP